MTPCLASLQNKLRLFSLYLCTAVFLFYGCESAPPPIPLNKKGILFLGHTYQWHTASDKVDERIERLDLSGYEQLWLGGDMCSETTEKKETLDYLDDLFDLGAPTTLWALGNHDYRNGNHDWIREKTGRDLHYVQNFEGMTVIVTNTSYHQTEECAQKEAQMEMIRRTCDTVSAASHLIFLSHMLTWTDVDPDMDAKNVANADKSWMPLICEVRSQFQRSVYPWLLQVQERGIQVVVIAGDVGQKDKYYQYQTSDGVWFLASGINNSFEQDLEKRALLPKDRLLYLEYTDSTRSLTWDFPILEEML